MTIRKVFKFRVSGSIEKIHVKWCTMSENLAATTPGRLFFSHVLISSNLELNKSEKDSVMTNLLEQKLLFFWCCKAAWFPEHYDTNSAAVPLCSLPFLRNTTPVFVRSGISLYSDALQSVCLLFKLQWKEWRLPFSVSDTERPLSTPDQSTASLGVAALQI